MSTVTEPHAQPEHAWGGSALAITIAAVLLMAIFQTVGVVRDRFALNHLRVAQQPTVEQGIKLRAQLQTIAGKTADLANSGDPAARDVLDLMHREGVTISPSKQAQPH